MDSLEFNEIIDRLTEADGTITTPLLKIKVFAHRINNAILYDWVSKEIDGYQQDEPIPKYRECSGVLIGTYLNGNTQVTSQPIPKGRYLKDIQIENIDFRQGIQALESLIQDGGENKEIRVEHNAEMIAYIQQGIREQGNEFFSLVNARTRISKTQVVGLISNIRNNLLDLMLKLDEKFSNVQDIKNKPNEVSKIVNKIVINAGAGSIVNTGDNNVLSNNNVLKGDKESLLAFLSQNGVPQRDINQLLEVIDHGYDETRSWRETMLKKAKDGAWNVNIGASGALLADAIKSYLGL